ncbi:MAG: collagenase, partial [candidate division WOR-3 bacterium]
EYFYPGGYNIATFTANEAESSYVKLKNDFKYEITERVSIILYKSHNDFQQTNVVDLYLVEGIGGVTELYKNRVVIPFEGSLSQLRHVLHHELVHAVMNDMLYGGSVQSLISGQVAQVPTWFAEGMAEYFSLGPDDPNTAMWMRDATKTIKKLPKAKNLEDPKYFPYRWGQALLAYIGGIWGDQKIPELLKSKRPNRNFYDNIKQVLGKSADSLSDDWHKALHDDYDPYIKLTKSPKDYGPVLISEKHSGGKLNVGPVISPDGKQLIFFSEKELW